MNKNETFKIKWYIIDFILLKFNLWNIEYNIFSFDSSGGNHLKYFVSFDRNHH